MSLFLSILSLVSLPLLVQAECFYNPENGNVVRTNLEGTWTLHEQLTMTLYPGYSNNITIRWLVQNCNYFVTRLWRFEINESIFDMIKEEADKFCDVVEDIYLTGEATIEWPFESDFTAGSGVICLSFLYQNIFQFIHSHWSSTMATPGLCISSLMDTCLVWCMTSTWC